MGIFNFLKEKRHKNENIEGQHYAIKYHHFIKGIYMMYRLRRYSVAVFLVLILTSCSEEKPEKVSVYEVPNNTQEIGSNQIVENETEVDEIDSNTSDKEDSDIITINLLPKEFLVIDAYTEHPKSHRAIYDFSDDFVESGNKLNIADKVNLYIDNVWKSWTVSELSNAVNNSLDYSKVVLKDKYSFYAFYTVSDQTYADLYNWKDSEFTKLKTINFEQKIDEIYVGKNTMVFQLNKNITNILILANLDCEPIVGYGVSSTTNILSLDIIKKDEPEFLVTFEHDDVSYVYSSEIYYGKFNGDHMLSFDKDLIVNGVIDEDMVVKQDSGGNNYYINNDTMELVEFMGNDMVVDKIEMPKSLFEEYDYREKYIEPDFWGVLKNGFLFNRMDTVYYYDFLTKDFQNIEKKFSNTIRYVDGKAYVRDGVNSYYRRGHYEFDEDQKKFIVDENSKDDEVKYNEYETLSWWGNFFVYDDIMYYDNKVDFVTGETELQGQDDKFKSISEMPSIRYGEGHVFVASSIQVEGIEYVRTIKDAMLGHVIDGVFHPNIKEAVNRYDCTKDGIIYSTYDEVNAVFYLDLDLNKTYKLTVEGKPKDVQLMGQYAYVLDEFRKIYRFDLGSGYTNHYDIAIQADIIPDVINEDTNYGRLMDNNEYLVYSNGLTLILDEKLVEYDRFNGSSYFITDDGYIYRSALIYYSRYNIESKKDNLIHTSYVHPVLYYDGKILFNSTYEGPGDTYSKDFYQETINPFSCYVDYTIEIGMSWDNYIILYDHEKQKLEIIDVLSNRVDYELTEEGLYYWEIENDNIGEKKFYPLREGSRVEIYSEKRL